MNDRQQLVLRPTSATSSSVHDGFFDAVPASKKNTMKLKRNNNSITSVLIPLHYKQHVGQ